MSYITDITDKFKEDYKGRKLNYIGYKGTNETVDGGSVSLFDFSRANLNEDSRIEAVTAIAGVCYAKTGIIGKDTLYNKLVQESIGLPSSSFEFVPILYTPEVLFKVKTLLDKLELPVKHEIKKFWSYHLYGGEYAVITNLRNQLTMIEALRGYLSDAELDLLNVFNTEEDCSYISKLGYTFLVETTMFTRTQLIRHRQASYQELSRRYTNDRTAPFTFRGGFKDAGAKALEQYHSDIKNGAKAELARGNLPQATMTSIWVHFPLASFDNFYRLRADNHAQSDIRDLTSKMLSLLWRE